MSESGNTPREPSINEWGELEELPHERLRRMLDRAGLSNGDVSAELDVVTETVSRWRNGAQSIDDDALRAIVRLLRTRDIRVTMGWMRYGEVPTERERDVLGQSQPAVAVHLRRTAVGQTDIHPEHGQEGKLGRARRPSGK